MMVVEFGWNSKFVVKTADAVKLLEILEKAEKYEDKWQKAEDGGTTHHVWSADVEDMPSLKLLSDATYQMAKLAGKPEKTK